MARSTYIYVVRTWPHESFQTPDNVATFTVKREAHEKYPKRKQNGLQLWRYKDGVPDEGVVIPWEEEENPNTTADMV